MKYHFIPLGGTQSQLKYIAGLPSWALTSVFQLFFQHLPSIIFVAISEQGSWEPISIHLIHLPLTSAILLFITIYQNHLTMYRWDLGPPTPCLPPGCPHRVILSPISGLKLENQGIKTQMLLHQPCWQKPNQLGFCLLSAFYISGIFICHLIPIIIVMIIIATIRWAFTCTKYHAECLHTWSHLILLRSLSGIIIPTSEL